MASNILEVKHEAGCWGCCKAVRGEVGYTREMVGHGVEGDWLAFYAHDSQDGEGHFALSFQILARGKSEAEVRAAVKTAGGEA